jgi:FlaG/FlaF family flagellin (archaellin)
MNIVRTLSVASSLLLTMAVPGVASVVVNSPTNGSDVDSPFTLSATAAVCSSESVATMGYSLDASPDSTIVDGTSIDLAVTASTGAHTLHVKAWGDKGASCVEDVTITVKSSGPSEPGSLSLPPGAVSNSNLQALGNWGATRDKGGVGHATGSTYIVTSPYLHGSTRAFLTHFTNSGDERYWVHYGDDTTALNFLYDAWVYLTDSTSNIANMEFDLNQVMPNGWTVVFGVQCDGYSHTWDYTTNLGTPKRWVDHWDHSGSKCNLQAWKKNTWHHVQATYSRNDAGVVTYHSVWLDGVESPINRTTPSAFELGWGPMLLTNFQVDGRGASGSNTVFLDSLTISRW